LGLAGGFDDFDVRKKQLGTAKFLGATSLG
jgi:hypothetical protein